MQAKQRLWQTSDKKRLVPEGHNEAAFLYCVPGDEIPESAAKLYGLVDGKLGGKTKQPETKELPGGETKNDLTEIKGIGKATAKALGEVGIDSFAKLAAIDPVKPPIQVTGLDEAGWNAWAVAAKTRLPPVGA